MPDFPATTVTKAAQTNDGCLRGIGLTIFPEPWARRFRRGIALVVVLVLYTFTQEIIWSYQYKGDHDQQRIT
jgi:hypothetical protein